MKSIFPWDWIGGWVEKYDLDLPDEAVKELEDLLKKL